MAVRKHEKGAIFEENQRISNVFRIARVRSTEQSVPYTSTRICRRSPSISTDHACMRRYLYLAVRKHEKGAIFEENQRISNVFRIARVRSTEQSVPYTRYMKYIRVIDMRQEERQGNTNVRF